MKIKYSDRFWFFAILSCLGVVDIRAHDNKLFVIAFPWAAGRLLTLIALSVTVQLLSGCTRMPDEKIYCRDENNKPLEGVLVICRYAGSTLMAYFSAGADYRFSDTEGVATFDENDVTRKLDRRVQDRIVTYTYSPRLRSGGGARGFAKVDDLFPISTVYQKERNDVIYYKDNRGDPVAWFGVLYYLTEESGDVIHRMAGYGKTQGYAAIGVDQVERVLVPLLKKEWAGFFQEYGDMLVPAGYMKARFTGDADFYSKKFGNTLRFNDLKELVNGLCGLKEKL